MITVYPRWPMHGVGVGMSEANQVKDVSVYSEVGIKTPNPPPSSYSVETQISPTWCHYPYTDNDKDM